MKSEKNQLQEFCQKREILLPTYTTTRIGGQDNLPAFQSRVVFNGKDYLGDVCTSKKGAEKSAANQALRSNELSATTQKQQQPQPTFTERETRPYLVLIDLENSPNYTMAKWQTTRWKNARIEAFVGKLSSHAQKSIVYLKQYYPFVDEIHIVNSGMKDAVDHAISVRAGEWLNVFRCNSSHMYGAGVFIVSRDRFAVALRDILVQHLASAGVGGAKIIHSVNIDECFEHFSCC